MKNYTDSVHKNILCGISIKKALNQSLLHIKLKHVHVATLGLL